jgi:hypothetical protein
VNDADVKQVPCLVCRKSLLLRVLRLPDPNAPQFFRPLAGNWWTCVSRDNDSEGMSVHMLCGQCASAAR